MSNIDSDVVYCCWERCCWPGRCWWERGRMIEKGGSSKVYEARTLPETPLARHFPPLMAVKSSTDYNRIRHENDILCQLGRHLNIIGLYFYSATLEDNRVIHNLLLEYATGGNLLDKINAKRGGLPEPVVSNYARDVLRGLETIHRHGFVHSDIKPENILIVDGYAKIADFGLATREMVRERIRGTMEYIAPEVVSDQIYTRKADIWSLGLTVLSAITGKSIWGPYNNYDSHELLNLIGYSDILPIIPITLSSVAVDFLSRCLVRDFEMRSTAEMLLIHPFVQRSYKLSYLPQDSVAFDDRFMIMRRKTCFM